MTENELAKIVVNLCLKIHKILGPGLLESVYEEVLVYELRKLGLDAQRQVAIAINYDGIKMDVGFRADILLENKLIIELKSKEAVHPVDKKQLLTHLKLAKKKLGLLVNFNVELIKDGITRIANGI
jgi:GxxExxY protein